MFIHRMGQRITRGVAISVLTESGAFIPLSATSAPGSRSTAPAEASAARISPIVVIRFVASKVGSAHDKLKTVANAGCAAFKRL
jgi:hypothetical protein